MLQTSLAASVWSLRLMRDEEKMEAAGMCYKNGGRIDTGLDAIEWAMQADKIGRRRNPSYEYGL